MPMYSSLLRVIFEYGGKCLGHVFQFFVTVFLLCLQGRRGRGLLLLVKLSVPGDRAAF